LSIRKLIYQSVYVVSVFYKICQKTIYKEQYVVDTKKIYQYQLKEVFYINTPGLKLCHNFSCFEDILKPTLRI